MSVLPEYFGVLYVYISALKTSRLTVHHSEAYEDGVKDLQHVCVFAVG